MYEGDGVQCLDELTCEFYLMCRSCLVWFNGMCALGVEFLGG